MPPTELAPSPASGSDIIERVIAQGDLAKLSPQERVAYYRHVCQSVGLNPFTRPFEYIMLSGKLTLYARRDAADQLRKINGISVEVVSRKVENDLVVVHVKARDKTGRTDEDFGAVTVTGLRGENLANAQMKCVPLDTEILTMEGWKTHDQLRIGEAVLGYNIDTDRTEWTLLEAVNRFDEMEMGTLETVEGRFSVRCSPGHRWVLERQRYKPVSTGARGIRGPYANRQPPRHFVNVEDIGGIGQLQRLVLAAPERDQIDSLLTPAEASVLGWAVTDGTIKRRGSFVSLGICQSKEANFTDIEAAVSAVSDRWTKCVTPATTRTFPSSGETYECLPQHWWYLPAEVSRSLLRRCGFSSKADLPRIITRLSSAARVAMLQAFIAAEGSVRPNITRFINTDDVLMDCFQILCALEGISTGNLKPRTIYEGYHPWLCQSMKKRRHIIVKNLRWKPDGSEPAWCPTTGLNTWVMRHYGIVTITGNCITKAKRRVTLSISGLGFLDETEVDDIPVTERVTAPATVTAELDDFAAMPEPQLVVKPEPPHSGTPFDLPPHPSERSGPPTPRRAAIWRKSSYALQPDKLLDGSDAWNQWALDLVRFIAEATNETELNKLASDNKERLDTLEELHAEARQRITDAAVRRRAKLREEAAP